MLSERLLRLMTAFVDGEVSAHQRRIVLHHLRTSPEARTLLKKLQDDASKLRQLPAVGIGQDLSEKILARIGDQVVRPIQLAGRESWSPVPRGFGLATAAAVLLALGFGSYYYLKLVSEKAPDIAARPGTADPLVALAPNGANGKSALTPESGHEAVPPPLKALEKEKNELPPPLLVEDSRSKPDRKDDSIYTTPSVPVPEGHFQVVRDLKLAMKLSSHDLVHETRRLDLLKRLASDEAQHIDLYCKQTRSALAQLATAFKAQGIRVVLAPDAADAYLFGKKPRTDYLLFSENLTRGEVLDILSRLAEDDRKHETKRKGQAQFGELFVNGVSNDDHKLLTRVLGVDPTPLQATPRSTPLGMSVLKPIGAGTADEVARSLQGQGRVPRPEPGKPALKTPERLVVVGTCNPVDPRPKSDEIIRFVESRKQNFPNTFQMLLILRRQP
jgi:hypothetical protein